MCLQNVVEWKYNVEDSGKTIQYLSTFNIRSLKTFSQATVQHSIFTSASKM